jgi:hypothetical protein
MMSPSGSGQFTITIFFYCGRNGKEEQKEPQCCRQIEEGQQTKP